jgi:hypothetical protein
MQGVETPGTAVKACKRVRLRLVYATGGWGFRCRVFVGGMDGILEAVKIIRVLRHPDVPNGRRQSVVVGTLSSRADYAFCQSGTSAQ